MAGREYRGDMFILVGLSVGKNWTILLLRELLFRLTEMVSTEKMRFYSLGQRARILDNTSRLFSEGPSLKLVVRLGVAIGPDVWSSVYKCYDCRIWRSDFG